MFCTILRKLKEFWTTLTCISDDEFIVLYIITATEAGELVWKTTDETPRLLYGDTSLRKLYHQYPSRWCVRSRVCHKDLCVSYVIKFNATVTKVKELTIYQSNTSDIYNIPLWKIQKGIREELFQAVFKEEYRFKKFAEVHKQQILHRGYMQ